MNLVESLHFGCSASVQDSGRLGPFAAMSHVR
jgi:hypothetical protein